MKTKKKNNTGITSQNPKWRDDIHSRNTDENQKDKLNCGKKTVSSFHSTNETQSNHDVCPSDPYNPLEEKHLVVCKRCGDLIDVTKYMKENLLVQRQNDIREFERFIIENDWFYRCPDYSKDCPQCQFWRDFDKKFKSKRIKK